MSTSWLATADTDTAWAHQPWSSFGAGTIDDNTIAALPVHGFADHGLGLPLDSEEILGSALLKAAVTSLGPQIKLRVLPPLRFGLAPYPSTFFGIDPETASDLVHEIAAGIKVAGFSRLLFFNTSPWNAEFIDAVSRDVRVGLGLQSFIINLDGLGFDFHPASDRRSQTQAATAHLIGQAPKSSKLSTDISDAGFRPGNFRQPAPLAFDSSLDGAALLAGAAKQLSGLLKEISDRPPLAGKRASSSRQTSTHPTQPPAFPAGTIWPSYRDRYLAALTRDELDALPNKSNTLVIIPVGAIEQHGHHLPVGVDAILGQALLAHATSRFPANTPVVVAPSITYGKSNEHISFPGTLSVSAKTLRRLVIALASQLKALGFRQFALFNTHGGNSAVLVYTLREIQTSLGLRAGMVSSPFKPDVSAQEAEYGFHAGEVETSLMLAVASELVHMEKASCEFPARIDDPGELRPENAPATFSWATEDISKSGVMGDATQATIEKGLRWLEASAGALGKRLIDLQAGRA